MTRRRVLLQAGLVAGFLVAVAIVILVFVGNAGSTPTASERAGPANMPTDGIAFTGVDGKVEPVLAAGVPAHGTPAPVGTGSPGTPTKVVTYIDWSCPVCKEFEAAYEPGILQLVAQGKATLEIHPVSILDSHYPGSRYSSRAANAAACVAADDPQHFLAVQAEFYDHQPAEGSGGLGTAAIRRLVAAGGAQDHRVAACIDHETFRAWVTSSTNRLLADPALVDPAAGGFGTPTVLVDGRIWDGSSDLLALIARG